MGVRVDDTIDGDIGSTFGPGEAVAIACWKRDVGSAHYRYRWSCMRHGRAGGCLLHKMEASRLVGDHGLCLFDRIGRYSVILSFHYSIDTLS